MGKEYGGYLPLELREGDEYFNRYKDIKVAKFNCGRNSIAAAFLSINPPKVFVPYYICNVVRETLEQYSIPYELYFIDSEMIPKIEVFEEGDWLLYVNYFGTLPKSMVESVVRQYRRVVIDNTQAFYAEPIFDKNCFNVYLPRKFFGLIDGAYLIWSGDWDIKNDYPVDISWNKGLFLFKSIELGTNAAYKDNLDSMQDYSSGIKHMSRLTERMLKSIDYDGAAEIRQNNYQILVKEFENVNKLPIAMEGYAPYVYPLLIKEDNLRRRLIEQKVYVSQWWKYLLDEVPDDSIEATLSKWLIPLPLDQRYNTEDMKDLARIVKSNL